MKKKEKAFKQEIVNWKAMRSKKAPINKKYLSKLKSRR